MQAPGHFCHFGERAVGSQVPLRRQLAALGTRIRALGLAPATSDALAAEVVTAVGHHRVGEVIEADGAGGLFLEVGGQVWGGHGEGGSAWTRLLVVHGDQATPLAGSEGGTGSGPGGHTPGLPE